MTKAPLTQQRSHKSTAKNTILLPQYQGRINKADILLVISIFIAFVSAGTMQFVVILKIPFSPKIFTMPMVMALIFSITLVRFRLMKRRLEFEREQKDFVKAKVELLNVQLKELLNQRTERLIAAQDQVTLAQARADLGAMSAGVIHDINNALTAISMGWEGLEYAEGDEINEYREAISTGLSKAMLISSEFKSFLRPPEDESTDASSLLRRLMSLLRRSMGARQKLDLQWEHIFDESGALLWIADSTNDQPPAELELLVAINEGHLTQIIMNLVVNARDAFQGNAGEVIVHVDASPDEVIFKVSDNGIGMSQELQEQIFEPFFTTKEEGEGTGLGLHVIDQLIMRAGGDLTLVSELGVGTTFTISLPRVRA